MRTTYFPHPNPPLDSDSEQTVSHAVKQVAVYEIDGQRFDTFAAAIESRENKIEAKIRHLFRDAPFARQVECVQWVLDNRAELRALLDY